VDRLEDVPTEATIDIHEPKPCADPLAHAYSSYPPVPGAGIPSDPCHREQLRECPPRLLSTTVLVHLDSSIFIRPAPVARNHWTSRDDDNFDDGDDEEFHHWAHGVPDDVWF
jgi:hypothetical protein